MSDIEWPVLWIEEDDLPPIGTPDLEWQGKPLTFPTVDEWSLSMARDSLATLTVRIPVLVRTRKRENTAAEPSWQASDLGLSGVRDR